MHIKGTVFPDLTANLHSFFLFSQVCNILKDQAPTYSSAKRLHGVVLSLLKLEFLLM